MRRLRELDGLRGLAALQVFLSHSISMANRSAGTIRLQKLSLLATLWDGRSAVALFFVLSGFVLCYPRALDRPARPGWTAFLIRRVMRLYPAYWAALALALLLRLLVFRPAGLQSLSAWARSIWLLPIDRAGLLGHLVLLAPGLQTHLIDPVIWSLLYEMKMSLLFPALLLLVQATASASRAAMAVCLVLALSFKFHFCGVLLLFLAGAYAAKFIMPRLAQLESLRPSTKLVLCLVALLFYGAPNALEVLLPGLPPAAGAAATGVGALLLLFLFLACSPLQRLATWNPISILGDVSYSFYLLHLPILFALTSLLYPRTHSLLLCCASAFILSLAAAWASFRWIEMPGHLLGKRWAAPFLPPRGAGELGAVEQPRTTSSSPVASAPLYQKQ